MTDIGKMIKEMERVNSKKIKVTKGDESALDLKKQKYALFEITTNDNNTVYLYCSDVESNRNGEDVYGIFEYTNHKSISVIACDTEKVTNMGRMFSECSNLKDLEFGKIFDTSNVTNMSFMFYDCEQIKNLDIRNFDVKNVNNIFSMFKNCKNLETLNFKHFDDLDKNTECKDLFYNCQKLTKIDMDDFYMLRHFAEKENNQIFQKCNSLNNEYEINMNEKEINMDEKEKNKNIGVVNILKKRAEEEKQKMKDEEEKKIKEEEQKMKEEVENNIKAYKEKRNPKEKIEEKTNKNRRIKKNL